MCFGEVQKFDASVRKMPWM